MRPRPQQHFSKSKMVFIQVFLNKLTRFSFVLSSLSATFSCVFSPLWFWSVTKSSTRPSTCSRLSHLPPPQKGFRPLTPPQSAKELRPPRDGAASSWWKRHLVISVNDSVLFSFKWWPVFKPLGLLRFPFNQQTFTGTQNHQQGSSHTLNLACDLLFCYVFFYWKKTYSTHISFPLNISQA